MLFTHCSDEFLALAEELSFKYVVTVRVFGMTSSEFCLIFSVFYDFCGIWLIYLKFATRQPWEISEDLFQCPS